MCEVDISAAVSLLISYIISAALHSFPLISAFCMWKCGQGDAVGDSVTVMKERTHQTLTLITVSNEEVCS